MCIKCNERHDSTFVQSVGPKERHVYQVDRLVVFSTQKSPKEWHDYILVKRLDPKESHGSFYWQFIEPNENHVRNERHVSLFKPGSFFQRFGGNF